MILSGYQLLSGTVTLYGKAIFIKLEAISVIAVVSNLGVIKILRRKHHLEISESRHEKTQKLTANKSLSRHKQAVLSGTVAHWCVYAITFTASTAEPVFRGSAF